MPDMPLGFGWIRRKADKGIWLMRPVMGKPQPKERPLDPNRSLLEPQNNHSASGDIDPAVLLKIQKLLKERKTDE